MIRIDATTRKLEFSLSTAITTTSMVSYITYKRKTFREDQPERGGVFVVRSGTTTDVVALPPPPQNEVYEVDLWAIHNADTVSNVIYMKMDETTTNYPFIAKTVSSLQTLFYTDGTGFTVI